MKWWTKEEQDHPFSPLRTSPTNRGSFKTLTPLRLERKKKDKINHLSLLSPKKRKKERISICIDLVHFSPFKFVGTAALNYVELNMLLFCHFASP